MVECKGKVRKQIILELINLCGIDPLLCKTVSENLASKTGIETDQDCSTSWMH